MRTSSRRGCAVAAFLAALAGAPAHATPPPIMRAAASPAMESELETIDIETGERTMVYRTGAHIEAPNWTRDGSALIFNGGGRLYRLPLRGGVPRRIPLGDANNVNNDHGLSPNGRMLAVSDQSHGPSLVRIAPARGGPARTLTPRGPSYWHGWSPDGRSIAFIGERGGNFDVYTASVDGGPERRLTTDLAPDDGADYAPDGRIFFNSGRTGRMQIWCMNADGSDQRRVTDDGDADWFPHPSPDGRWLVFLAYDGSVRGHPPDKAVTLRIMPLDRSAPPRVLARLFGGQGTINVPSWAPDSRHLAFVSYRLVPPQR